MIDVKLCPSCGQEVPAGSPEGLCPRCLLRAGTAPPASPDADVPPLEALPSLFPGHSDFVRIGRGGMGVVFRARHDKLGRIVAIKVLPRRVDGDPRFVERFLREAQALASLSHPHVLTLYDFGETDGWFWLVAEYVDGPNLRERLRRGRIAAHEAIAIAGQICDALAYAHARGIVHRDIKPENVLLGADGRVRVADFGLAKLAGAARSVSLTGSGEAVGTPHYMAPEQVEAGREIDARADVFSLGVVLYELLTGELPIGHFAPPSAKSEAGAEVDAIVMRSLRREPADRYQSCAEVSRQLAAAAPGTGPGSEERMETTTVEQRRLGIDIQLILAFLAIFFASFMPWATIGGKPTVQAETAWHVWMTLKRIQVPAYLPGACGLVLAILVLAARLLRVPLPVGLCAAVVACCFAGIAIGYAMLYRIGGASSAHSGGLLTFGLFAYAGVLLWQRSRAR